MLFALRPGRSQTDRLCPFKIFSLDKDVLPRDCAVYLLTFLEGLKQMSPVFLPPPRVLTSLTSLTRRMSKQFRQVGKKSSSASGSRLTTMLKVLPQDTLTITNLILPFCSCLVITQGIVGSVCGSKVEGNAGDSTARRTLVSLDLSASSLKT